jgi:cardiolipin synthase
MSSPLVTGWKWLRNGREAFPAMLLAIKQAKTSIRLEMYIYSPEAIGVSFRDALVSARNRGVSVKVLIDAMGSIKLPNSFWESLREVGGEVRVFNPLALGRFGIRNHRKLMVCDEEVSFIGGFNIAPEYDGDGITHGWCDLGLQFTGPIATQLSASFDQMFAMADFRQKRLARFRPAQLRRTPQSGEVQVLLGRPGLGLNPIKRSLRKDLLNAKHACLMVAYFLPTGRLRRGMLRAARRGGDIQLILAGKSDVPLSRLAGQSLYRRLLKAGASIYEYAPQILHAKLFVLDDVVYVGSANLDPRSLSINYELTLRFQNPQMADEARNILDEARKHCQRIQPVEWQRTRTFWARLKRRWSHFLLARIDPYISLKQWRSMPD